MPRPEVSNSATLAASGLMCAALFVAGVVLPYVVGRIESRAATKRDRSEPHTRPRTKIESLEIIIPAYLEANGIAQTIARLRTQLGSSRLRSSIAVIASDPETADASTGADRVMLIGRDGKPAALNIGVRTSSADAVIFMDGNCTLEPANWLELFERELETADVVSALKSELHGHEGAYWRMEDWIKSSHPPELGSLSVVGEFIGMRRENFVEIPHSVVLDDLWLARTADTAGLLVRIALGIRTVEEAVSAADQWERRSRNAEGQFRQGLGTVFAYRRTPAGRIYLAHKLYRYTVGPLSFWCGTALLSASLGPVSLALAAAISARAILEYAGRCRHRVVPSGVATLIGMQAIPFLGAARAIRHVMQSGIGASEPYRWKKVPR